MISRKKSFLFFFFSLLIDSARRKQKKRIRWNQFLKNLFLFLFNRLIARFRDPEKKENFIMKRTVGRVLSWRGEGFRFQLPSSVQGFKSTLSCGPPPAPQFQEPVETSASLWSSLGIQPLLLQIRKTNNPVIEATGTRNNAAVDTKKQRPKSLMRIESASSMQPMCTRMYILFILRRCYALFAVFRSFAAWSSCAERY